MYGDAYASDCSSGTAFISILISAIESFPSKYKGSRKPKGTTSEGECYGLLFGQRINKNSNKAFNVTIAIPMQIIESRTHDQVTPSIKHFDRIKSVLESYPMFQFLGTFHSHPYPKNKFTGIKSIDASKTDKKSALEDAEELGGELVEIIISMTHLKSRSTRSEPDVRWPITQNYCGNYKYAIAAYCTNTPDQELELVDNLICPLAAGVGNYDLKLC
ncbi:MAG: hypothetical protein FJ139_01730 [Deltaproteobacteria bacterium]|nr:hypothetical protein [Deltaproteobacteria bacterium]